MNDFDDTIKGVEGETQDTSSSTYRVMLETAENLLQQLEEPSLDDVLNKLYHKWNQISHQGLDENDLMGAMRYDSMINRLYRELTENALNGGMYDVLTKIDEIIEMAEVYGIESEGNELKQIKQALIIINSIGNGEISFLLNDALKEFDIDELQRIFKTMGDFFVLVPNKIMFMGYYEILGRITKNLISELKIELVLNEMVIDGSLHDVLAILTNFQWYFEILMDYKESNKWYNKIEQLYPIFSNTIG